MKKTYILLALVCGLFASCMNGNDGLFNDNWDETDTLEYQFGNPYIKETNVVSIASLKQKYASVIAADGGMELFTQPTQIKGIVTSNDIEGNIYNEVTVEDGTGTMIIGISQGGLFAQLPEGQEILVELNGLYIGSYGKQPQIGTPYTNKNGRTYVSRMSRHLWQNHFTITGEKKTIEPVIFDQSKLNDDNYMKDNCGKLMTIKNVTFMDAPDSVYASEFNNDAANCTNRELTGFSSKKLIVRTSTYADFAAKKLPAGALDITGIFTRYNNTWQILIRKETDVKPAE